MADVTFYEGRKPSLAMLLMGPSCCVDIGPSARFAPTETLIQTSGGRDPGLTVDRCAR